jgi:N-acetylglucosaminyldiphosphoundecaprenol N-acetyl-beta-D-mannosaminyltransferase
MRETALGVAGTLHYRLLGVPVAATNMSSAIGAVSSWVRNGDRGRMVTFTTVHMVVEAGKNSRFAGILEESDLNCPDGMPLVWCGRRMGNTSIQRVCGPEFLPAFCEATVDMKLRHFFFGGAEGVAAQAVERLTLKIPDLCVAGVYSPPYRPLTAEEDAALVAHINSTRPDVVWVCLGCPKQEIWIAEHKDKLGVPVMLAVGFALEVAAGTRKRAPRIFQRLGLEWAHRLLQDPRRLWKRYLVYNSIFLYRLLTESLESSEEELPQSAEDQ